MSIGTLAVSASLLSEKKPDDKAEGADADGKDKTEKRDPAADCTVPEIVAILGTIVCACVYDCALMHCADGTITDRRDCGYVLCLGIFVLVCVKIDTVCVCVCVCVCVHI